MLKSMRRFDNEADHLYAELQSYIAESKPSMDADLETKMVFVRDVLNLVNRKRECQLDAHRCATDAAPYIHPKMGSIDPPKPKNDTMDGKDENEMSQDELRDYYNDLRIRPLSVEPLKMVPPTIDNESGDVVVNEYTDEDDD